jgi:hypothetical protein
VGGHKVSDPLSKLQELSDPRELRDRPGARLYLVRVLIPSIKKYVSTVVEVTDGWVDSPEVQSRSRLDRLSREETFRAVAIDSVRIQLEKSGFTEEQLMPAKISECRQVTAQEALGLVVEMSRKEGN